MKHSAAWLRSVARCVVLGRARSRRLRTRHCVL